MTGAFEAEECLFNGKAANEVAVGKARRQVACWEFAFHQLCKIFGLVLAIALTSDRVNAAIIASNVDARCITTPIG